LTAAQRKGSFPEKLPAIRQDEVIIVFPEPLEITGSVSL
jgi:hypothetical protein